MKPDLRRVFRLAVLPVACAAALSACAPYDPNGTSVYTSGGPSVGGSPMARFDRLDTNRDGFLSRAEASQAGLPASGPAVPVETAASMFRRLDTNGDSFLSPAEAGSTFNGIPGGSFQAFDINRDGFISMSEAMPHLQYLENRAATPTMMSFDGLDTNRDGFLSRTEAASFLASDRHAMPATVRGPAMSFSSLDVNRDGYLSRAEAVPIANPMTFDRYDSNRDGFLSRTEVDYLLRSGIGQTQGAYGGTLYGPR